MNEPSANPAPPANTGPLWAAVGALSVAVLGMGGAFVYTQMRTPAPAAMPAAVPAVAVAAAPAPAGPSVSPTDEVKAPPAPDKQKDSAPKNVAKAVPKPAKVPAQAVGQSGPMVAAGAGPQVPVPVKPVCAYCGTVEIVTPVEREGAPSGAGVVAGGVLGAIVGNQMGDGNGRTAATILGAIGGGFAGNAVEKKMKKVTAYLVQVRMEDGSARTLELATPASVGAKVTLEGSSLRNSDGSVLSPLPPPPKPVAPTFSTGG